MTELSRQTSKKTKTSTSDYLNQDEQPDWFLIGSDVEPLPYKILVTLLESIYRSGIQERISLGSVYKMVPHQTGDRRRVFTHI